jgi:outer membrane protein assembly factor BamB
MLLFVTSCKLPDQGSGKIGPIKKWGVSLGERVQSIPAVDAKGNIYVGAANSYLYALNNRGRFLWSYQVDGQTKVLSPALAPNGEVVFATSDGHLIALDSYGKLLWDRQPRKKLVGCPPVVTANGIVITSGDLVLIAYHLKNGKEVELGKKFPPVQSCVSSSPMGHIYFADGKQLHAWTLEGEQLRSLWSKEMGTRWSLPNFDREGNLYFGTEDGRLFSLTPQGQERWSYPAPKLAEEKTIYGINGLFARPVISPKGQIIAVRIGEGIYALDHKGQRLWVFPEGVRPFNGYLNVDKGGMIYAGSFDHHIYAITPTGREHYRFFTRDRVFFGGAFSPDGSTLYIGSEDKHLYALHTRMQGPNPTTNPVNQIK